MAGARMEVSTAGIVGVPAAPPQSAGEVVLLEAMSAVNDDIIRGYVNTMFKPATMTEAERDKCAEAVLTFSAVGWAYYNWHKQQSRLISLSVPEAQILGVIPPRKEGELPSKVQRVRAKKAAEKKAAAKPKRKARKK